MYTSLLVSFLLCTSKISRTWTPNSPTNFAPTGLLIMRIVSVVSDNAAMTCDAVVSYRPVLV